MEASTEADRFLVAQVQPLLRPQEAIVTCAYLSPTLDDSRVGAFIDAASKMAAFAAVTSERLILVQTRIGAFKPLLENHGVLSFERAEIRGVLVGRRLLVDLADGRMLQYDDNRTAKHVSTQRDFFDRLETLLGRSEAAAQLAAGERKRGLVGLVIGVILAALYVLYRVMAGR